MVKHETTHTKTVSVLMITYISFTYFYDSIRGTNYNLHNETVSFSHKRHKLAELGLDPDSSANLSRAKSWTGLWTQLTLTHLWHSSVTPMHHERHKHLFLLNWACSFSYSLSLEQRSREPKQDRKSDPVPWKMLFTLLKTTVLVQEILN